MADQTWDDFLMTLADDYLSPALKRDMDRRWKSDRIVPGTVAKREYEQWRRRSGLA